VTEAKWLSDYIYRETYGARRSRLWPPIEKLPFEGVFLLVVGRETPTRCRRRQDKTTSKCCFIAGGEVLLMSKVAKAAATNLQNE
jgi:hypothetical protein